ncbi:hypothetical protein H6800_03530 [Candidatus Nomurabacteria bacterium]|nr:hypothetical protein [Candidatus Nomurabacteria bacterium]
MKALNTFRKFKSYTIALIFVVLFVSGIGVNSLIPSTVNATAQPEATPNWQYLGPEGNVFVKVCKLGAYPADGFIMQAKRQTRTPKYLWMSFTGVNSSGDYVTVRLDDYSLRRPTSKWGPVKTYKMYSLDNTIIVNMNVMHNNSIYSHGTLGFKFKNINYCQ